MAGEYKSADLGREAEEEACAYLERRGLVFVEKNYRCLCGEIDLIMKDRAEYVFVEVRLRCYDYLGSAVESVTRDKQLKLIRAATLYLQEKKLLDTTDCRFDILGINDKNQFDWIQNAFSLGFI